MTIKEHFISLQGEGRDAGRRSYFIRFNRCNLACAWCDTDFVDGTISLEQLTSDPLFDNPHPYIFTGGEPLLFIKEIAQILSRRPKRFSLETNGMVLGSSGARRLLRDRRDLLDAVAVSPKLYLGERRLQELTTIAADLAPEAFLKFVISSESELRRLEQVMAAVETGACRLYLTIEHSRREDPGLTGALMSSPLLDRDTSYYYVQLHKLLDIP